MCTPEPADSPRLAILRQALELGHSMALLDFWDEITKQGTPLVEPLPGDETHSLVTFLWRDGDSAGVTLLCLLAGRDGCRIAICGSRPTARATTCG